jgi:hypothetical protein
MPARAPREENTPMHTSLCPQHSTHPNTPITTSLQNGTATETQNICAGYTRLPLPTLRPTKIRIFSHNINTLSTTSIEELGVSFDMYRHLNPSIIGLQETNKNWSKYDATRGRVKQCTDRRWPGSKLVTAHCNDDAFQSPYQPGGVAQIVLRQLTARII